jgi:phage gp45-like
MEDGSIKDQNIETNRDGDKNVRMISTELSDTEDVQDVQLYGPPGEDANPPKNSRVVVIDLGQGEAFKVIVAIDDLVEPDSTIDLGEKKVYSSENGAIKAFIEYKKDGKLRLNTQNENDFAVRFNELNATLDDLVQKVNNNKAVFDSHIHTTTATVGPGPTPGVISPTTTPQTDVTFDLSKAKVDNIIFPEYEA